MKVKLTYTPLGECYTDTKVVEVQDNVCDPDVQAMFQIEFGVAYNKYECGYEADGKGKIYTLEEAYAFTE